MEKISYFFFSALFRLMSWLPFSWLRWMGRVLGRCLLLTSNRSHSVTAENIAACFPALTASEQQHRVALSLQNLGMTALEMPYVWCRSPATVLSKIESVDGLSHLEQALNDGKGVIILGPHIGNWELIGLYLGQRYPMTIMYQPPANPALEDIIIRSRERAGAKLVPTNTSGVKAQLRALKKGELVGVLPDQVPPPESGDFAPFFGVPALTPTMTYNLLNRTGAKAIFAVVKRNLQRDTFQLQFMAAPETIYSDDQQQSLQGLNHGVEQCVLMAPEQYQWEYKRFKRQPKGAKKYYQKS